MQRTNAAPRTPAMGSTRPDARPLIGPGPKRGRIASRERMSLDFKEKTIAFSLNNFFFIDFYCLKVRLIRRWS